MKIRYVGDNPFSGRRTPLPSGEGSGGEGLLHCREIGAAHFVLARHLLLGRSRKAVKEMTCTCIAESGLLKRLDHLCNLQSAGNSSGPQIDVVACILGQFHPHRDVGELQPAAWFHHAIEFGK
jgi:hypothetical protein